ncbi:MAG: hypothetical protein WBL92_08225, partial [Methanothrix sp.]
MAGIEPQDVQGLGLGQIIAASRRPGRLGHRSPSSLVCCCLLPGGTGAGFPDRRSFPGAGGKS